MTDKNKNHWIVVNELGEIANGFKHPTEAQANRHCAALEAFFGGENEK